MVSTGFTTYNTGIAGSVVDRIMAFFLEDLVFLEKYIYIFRVRAASQFWRVHFCQNSVAYTCANTVNCIKSLPTLNSLNIIVKWLELLLRIQEVPSLNLELEIDYTD
jgi:hypothetical protein